MALTGVIARVLSFTRIIVNGNHIGQVKADPDGGDARTYGHMASPGDDSPPLPTDRLAGLPLPATGTWGAVAYQDPLNAGTSIEGEKRIYGRDGSGAQVSEVHLQRDGTIVVQNPKGSFKLTPDGALEATITTLSIKNANGSIEMGADGTVTINKVKISSAGEVTNAAGIVLGTHTHPPGSYVAGVDAVVGLSGVPLP